MALQPSERVVVEAIHKMAVILALAEQEVAELVKLILEPVLLGQLTLVEAVEVAVLAHQIKEALVDQALS